MIPGLGRILSFFDLFQMRKLVNEANLKIAMRTAVYGTVEDRSAFSGSHDLPGKKRKKTSPEQVVLQLARKNRGVVTPGEVALNSDMSMDNANEYLEKLVAKGFAEMRIRKSGSIAYCFPDFFDDAHSMDFEEI
jgi:predicted transcriptional regulator